MGQPIPPPYKHQEVTINHLLGNDRSLDTSDPGCVDATTEFLTPIGWKRIDQYEDGDLVAQFDPETGQAAFVHPDAYIKKPCTEMLRFLTDRGVDQLLSPEHRMLVYKDTGDYEVASAEDVAHKHWATQQGFKRFFKTTFELDGEGAPLSEAQLRVQVAVMADAHIRPDCPNRCTVNVKREDKKLRISALLHAAGIEYRRSNRDDGYSRFSFAPPLKTKTPTPELWNLTSSQRGIVADECAYWDGSRRKAGAVTFSSRDKATADWVQLCAATSGKTATLSAYSRTDDGVDYSVHIRRNVSRVGLKGGSQKARVSYEPTPDGFKYCFTIPTSFFVARRNGRIFATGNTGKTRSHLEAFARRKEAGTNHKMLVLGTLSILETAWKADCAKWTPQLTAAVVYSSKRAKDLPRAIESDIIILNHDAVKWMIDKKGKLTSEGQLLTDNCDVLVVDEFTAFKHRTSQRSKAASAVRHYFPVRWALSGTPNSNGICDIWHPAYLVDDGERLGRAFWGFRAQVCTPVPNHNVPGGNHVDWVDKRDAELIVADKIHDITVRHKLRECIDMPDNVAYTVGTTLPKKLMAQYQEMRNEAALLLESGEYVNSVHAGAKAGKLLQICSGAIYSEGGEYHVLDDSRAKLALDLAMEADQALIAFNWRHQRDQLITEAERRKLSYAVIDGNVPVAKRVATVNAFQAGEIKYIFAHPQAASHGLTLTKGTRTIWTSPTYNAEWFQQFNARIDRAGQTQRTETIMIAARGTREEQVYEQLSGKVSKMDNLLAVFAASTATRKVA
jgi:hypothetical protein